MDADKLLPVVAFLGIVGVFLFAIGSGIYMAGASLYNYIKRGSTQKASVQVSADPRNLRAACFFFAFVGVVTIVIGVYTWTYQPADRGQVLWLIISGVYFFGLALIAHKKKRP